MADAPTSPNRVRMVLDALLFGGTFVLFVAHAVNGLTINLTDHDSAGPADVLPISFWILMGLLMMSAVRLTAMLPWDRMQVAGLMDRARGENATASVEFLILLPVYLMTVAAIVQMAYIGRAAMVVNYAAFSAARSAAVVLNDDREALLQSPTTAAEMVVAAVTPKSSFFSGQSEQAGKIAEQLRQFQNPDGMLFAPRSIDRNIGRRFSLAQELTTVEFTPQLDQGAPIKGPTFVTATVTYQYAMQIPGAQMILAGPFKQTIGGYRGRFFEIEASCTLLAAPGREYYSPIRGLFPGF